MIDTARVGDQLDVYTFQQLITDALAMVPATVDKRQGSIIYDTLAVSDVQLAEGYIVLKGYYIDSYALTAHGNYLDLRVAEAGVTRYPATQAVKLGVFSDSSGNPASVPMGAVFSTADDTQALNFTVTGVYEADGAVVPGSYRLTCQTSGTAGNDYAGPLLPVTYLTGIATATMSDLLIPARDTEADDALLARYLEIINRPAFGGNIAQYRQWVMDMNLVGAVQIYPVWMGGGTVKVSIIGSDYSPASDTLIDEVQTALDPEENQGIGLGIAPIGHFVTVTTPDPVQANVEANLTLRPGVTIGQVETQIKAAISAYLLDRRKLFGASSDANVYAVNIYRARISAAMMQVDGVENVTNVLLNGVDDDLILTQTALVQQLPMDGTVILHAV
jgi:uncharacterized phage protein gp47/JayE